MQEQLETSTTTDISFPVDPEPFGLRLTMIGILIASGIATYIGVTAILDAGTFNLIALFGAFLGGAIVLNLAEKPLKSNWPKTRFVTVSDDMVTVKHGDNIFRNIDPQQQVNVFKWYFTVDRRSRVPKGWHVVAIALEQDEIYLPVFTVMPQEDFIKVKNNFTQLPSRKALKNSKTDLRLAGQQRRLHTAEASRGLDGSEMNPDDFQHYIAQLEARFPRWMPKSST